MQRLLFEFPSRLGDLSSVVLTWTFGFALASGVWMLVLLDRRSAAATSKFKRIPGPFQVPIIGNIGQVDSARQHPKFLEWARRYGEIYQVRFGSNRIVVLNSAKASIELLDRRSAIYSCRHGPHFVHELVSGGQRQGFLPYAKEWKVSRASVHPFLIGSKSLTYRTMQEHESAVLIKDLWRHTQHCLSQPQRHDKTRLTHETSWEAHVRRYTTSVVMSITYGRRVTSTYRNPELHKIYDVLANLSVVAQPGQNACDGFPILTRLPDWLAPWRARGRAMHKWELELWGGLLERAKRDLQQGKARQGYVASMLEKRQQQQQQQHSEGGPPQSFEGKGLNAQGQMTDLFLAYTAATLLEAGSDTTATSIYFFVLVCLNQPRIWDRLFDEVKSACGDSLPTFQAIEGLPCLRACIKETFRRRPAAIMGVPHRLMRDDVYDGYLIREGTIVLGNVWAIHHDPERYPDPERFDPDRFMSDNLNAAQSAATMDPDRRDHYAFGWGRRVCQGMHVAENSLMIVFARLVWSFTLETPLDSPPPRIDDEEGSFLPGFVSQTKAFDCYFMPRSSEVERVLDIAASEAQEYWLVNDLELDQRDHYYKA